MSELTVIPLARIRPNLNQVRRTFHRIDELARSIAQYGLLQNLVVRPLPEAGYYEIVAGERRYRALTLLAKDGRLEKPRARRRRSTLPTAPEHGPGATPAANTSVDRRNTIPIQTAS